jgi:uncharacterized membrane protein
MGNWFTSIFGWLFSIGGAIIILIGIGAIFGYLEEKNLVKHEWQAGLILLIIALCILALANLIN